MAATCVIASKLTIGSAKEMLSVAWRESEASKSGDEVLLFTDAGVRPLHHLDRHAVSYPTGVGPILDVGMAGLGPDPAQTPWKETVCTASDGSSDVFFATQTSIWLLDKSNSAHLVAGRPNTVDASQLAADGPGSVAEFKHIKCMTHGLGGRLYVLDNGCLRVVQLQIGSALAQSVSTVRLSLEDDHLPAGDSRGLAYDSRNGILYLVASYSGDTAMFKFMEPIPHEGTLQSAAWLVGNEVQQEQQPGEVRVRPAFLNPEGLAVASTGEVVLVDALWLMDGENAGAELMFISPEGWQHSPAVSVEPYKKVALLPGGGVVLYHGVDKSAVQLVPCGLKASRRHGTILPRVVADKTCLGADLGSLLGSSPPFPPDVTVVVGGRAFPAHRLVLASRCEYFARRFAGGFRDSDDSMIALEGADPEAFELLLRYLYTGELRPTGALLRPLLELADRLLLLRASQHLLGQLREGSGPATVVADMVWAAERGLEGALEGLKAYYLEVAAEVAEQAPDSLMRLMTQQSKLHLELHMQVAKRMRLR